MMGLLLEMLFHLRMPPFGGIAETRDEVLDQKWSLYNESAVILGKRLRRDQPAA